jgi:hypothetical protein
MLTMRMQPPFRLQNHEKSDGGKPKSEQVDSDSHHIVDGERVTLLRLSPNRRPDH